MIKPTPSFPRVQALCKSKKWESWDGYAIADTYGFHAASEYLAVRKNAALFDFFPLNVFYIYGPDAAALLDKLVTRNIGKCKLNQAMYTALCDHQGKLLDDGIVIRIAEDVYQLSTNTALLDWLKSQASGLDVQIQDKTLEINTLQLHGPKSRLILNAVCAQSVDKLRYFQAMKTTLGDIPVMITRSGYSSDLSYEIWSDSKDTLAIWDSLMKAGESHQILPAGFTALDIIRIEGGLLWYDYDFKPSLLAESEDEKCSPFELGLDWVVDLSKSDFIGRAALVKEINAGVPRKFVGLELDLAALKSAFASVEGDEFDVNSLILQDLRNPWRTTAPINVYLGNVPVGFATSGCWSPACKAYVAMALVQSAALDTASKSGGLTLKIENKYIPVKTKEMPFYDPEHKLSKFA